MLYGRWENYFLRTMVFTYLLVMEKINIYIFLLFLRLYIKYSIRYHLTENYDLWFLTTSFLLGLGIGAIFLGILMFSFSSKVLFSIMALTVWSTNSEKHGHTFLFFHRFCSPAFEKHTLNCLFPLIILACSNFWPWLKSVAANLHRATIPL